MPGKKRTARLRSTLKASRLKAQRAAMDRDTDRPDADLREAMQSADTDSSGRQIRSALGRAADQLDRVAEQVEVDDDPASGEDLFGGGAGGGGLSFDTGGGSAGPSFDLGGGGDGDGDDDPLV